MNHAHEAMDETSGRLCRFGGPCTQDHRCNQGRCKRPTEASVSEPVSRWAALLGYYDAVAWAMALCMLVGVFRG